VEKPTLPIPSINAAAEDRGDRSAAAARSSAPQAFAGRYEILSRLGLGGMAEVFLARDTALCRLVALKLLAPALAADPVFVERFRREATAIASLNHANVVVIYDHDVADGQPYIAMEYVAGRTLKQIMTDSAPLPPGDAIAFARQTLDGLAAAHAMGIVHRDIKPQNLIVRDDGTLKVADFGVARSADETVLTQHGSVIGTADYISPEQARGEVATSSSDLYSAGVVLFEMLAGALPFTGELPVAVANQHVRTPAPSLLAVNPAVPVALARIVSHALSKEPAQRYGSAAEMKAALEEPTYDPPQVRPTTATVRMPVATADTQILPPTTPAAPPRARASTRRAVLVAALAVAALLLAVAFALSTRDHARPSRVVLPRIAGTPVATANSALRERGFVVRVIGPVHASEPAGTVAAVRPNTTSAAFGTTIAIVPSSGPSPITIPAVSGYSKAAAVAALQRLGLTAQLSTAYGPTPSGTATTTTPPAGTAVPPHSSITLSISAGPAPVPPANPTPPGKANGHANGKEYGNGNGKKQKHQGGD
jgi:beta-lactam-binding protein with PASTA domain